MLLMEAVSLPMKSVFFCPMNKATLMWTSPPLTNSSMPFRTTTIPSYLQTPAFPLFRERFTCVCKVINSHTDAEIPVTEPEK